MKRWLPVLLTICLFLTGCATVSNRYYVSVTPHTDRQKVDDQGIDWISSYDDLLAELTDMVHDGTQSDVFFVRNYNQGLLNRDISLAQQNIKLNDPVGAYALDHIHFELGVNAGQSTMVVRIDYLHSWSEIAAIQKVRDIESARKAIGSVLSKCSTDLVMYIEDYAETDFEQMAEDYAMDNPDVVMETPKVTAMVYPEEGSSRVVELKFSYQTNRDSLRDMQSVVEHFFDSAEGYVSGDETAYEMYNHLYIMLMQRYNYKLDTSITPTYSLLRHGVGDSKAFATVYSAMCRKVGLECIVVSGTRDGEPWFWNIVCDDGVYYHLDLHRCDQETGYLQREDDEMDGYVWDFSAYPVCGADTEYVPMPGMHGNTIN